MKSVLGLSKLVQHLDGYVEVLGTEVDSDLTQSWKYTDRGAANTIIRMRNLDSLPMACQKTELLPYKLS